MSRLQPPADAPNQIRLEGLQITLTFTKTGPTTGRVSWNIPSPAFGCNEDNQAYNGIVITYDTVAASLSTTPTNKIVYTADPTASQNLHAGDTIGTALVIGAFYDDKDTTFFDITNLPANTPVYISGYAVDKQLRYHREGTHAYSLPTGVDSPNKREQLPSYQLVLLGAVDNSSLFDINLWGISNISTGANAGDSTGLSSTTSYTFNIFLDPKDTTGTVITIDGADAQTFGDLVDAINLELRLMSNYPQSAGLPNAGALYYNTSNDTVYVWDGEEHTAAPTVTLDDDPIVIATGEYWFKNSTSILKQWTGSAWNTTSYVTSDIDPTSALKQSSYWFDGTTLHKWNGVVWCDILMYSTNEDPSTASYPDIGTYWYNTTTKILYQWKEDCNQWVAVEVIYDSNDPNAITTGSLWFNYETETMYVYTVDNVWSESLSPLTIGTAPTDPAVDDMWLDSSDVLRIWNGTTWIITSVTIYHADPTDRDSCQLWWNSNTDELYVWTFASPNGWVNVTNFIQSTNDPAAVPTLDAGTAWFNTDTELYYVWDGIDWIETEVMEYSHAPNLPNTNDVWYNASDEVWKYWNGSAWVTFTPFISDIDRNAIASGTYWFDSDLPGLFYWNGSTWISSTYQTTPYTPVEGYTYYNTLDTLLYTWTDGAWVEGTPDAYVVLNDQGNMVFITGELGSQAYVRITDGTLFTSISIPTFIKLMEPGRDEIPDVQGYAIEGVGSDGSSDERKQLMTYVLQRLGSPSINVELTAEQLDHCIRKALEEFRARSSSAYKRGFFFMNIVPGRQIYELSDKTVGFHKISRVMAAYRIQSSFLGNATGQGAYGQAMLQHLYQMGSFDLVSYHIMSDYIELMNMMFAANLMFTFDEDNRKLYFHQTFGSNERILLDVIVERTEQELMKDRICKVWLEKFATGFAMLMLAEIRGKFSTLPGAGGGVTLNATDMRTAGQELIDQCYTDIDEYIASEIENIGIGADIIIG